jgi:predicted nicotinamide N-methyase
VNLAASLSSRHEAFILANTVLQASPFVPELPLYLATSVIPFWQATETWLAQHNVDAPFWAFAWPGGLALARHVIDHPELVAGRRVLDFGSGCGIAGLAAARAGAAHVDVRDINPMAHAASRMNARANGLTVTPLAEDVVGLPCRWDLILAADVCYEAPMTRLILPWLRAMAAEAEVILADPGRAYLPGAGMHRITAYTVPTNLELEDRTEKVTALYRLEQPGR